ncbi:HNH endonuclease [Nocardioides anomalus]|uniref:HNH endonuclease n=1 Tax=Nocardioides anomalus TaxID=2712223 RepID=A0A6G6WGH0_9ACTN|nr:HNH endonuclease family protein [Nocardioides anomalus]QIG44306.1 HNH endonuclease [Nocardioides anomalus]
MRLLGRAASALATVLAVLAVALSLQLATAGAARADSQWSGTLTQAIDHIPVAGEGRTGYSRDAFRLWVDADGDGCDTRAEVLLAEAEDAPSVGSGCSLSGGRWYSYYDGVSATAAGDLDIDHVVPLAEAWDSGASAWSASRREAYANDLGDSHTLVGVTASLNRSKRDQDVAEWLPPINDCRYVKDWVVAKIRWGLEQDAAEKAALEDVAAGCADSSLSVSVVG